MVKSSNTKALDRWLFDFRSYANRVIYMVEKKYPRATVNMKMLMSCYAAGIPVKLVAQAIIQKHQIKGGG
jgi:hypothetical protein